MRKLLLLALTGMALSRMHFGSIAPPELKLRAPGFDLTADQPEAPRPHWFTRPAHLDPAWMHPHAAHGR